MIIYSIIIPHRNTPKLLSRLLDSIPHRTDTEVIIVDDNSSPEIVNFDNFPGNNRNDVIIIFDKEGKGAGNARNIGLDKARGHWVYFADADDVFTENLSALLDKYSNVRNIDMVFVNAKILDDEGQTHDFVLNKYIKNYKKKRYLSLDVLRFGIWTPWSRLISRSVFKENNILFEQIAVGNDIMGILNASRYSKTFAVESQIIYLYFKPKSGSQTHAASKVRPKYKAIENTLKINKLYLDSNFPLLRPLRITRKDKSDELNMLLKKYDYSRCKDALSYIKYYLAKFIGIL